METSSSSAAARQSAGVVPLISTTRRSAHLTRNPEPMEEKPTLHQIFTAEESPLLRFAYGLTGQREAAEDLVQDAFLRLHKHWAEVANPRAWLFRAVRNLALNHLRDNKRSTSLETTSQTGAEWETKSPDPEAALSRLEAIGTLRLLISELPEPDRTLVSLKYSQDLKYDQIATRTNLTVSNVGYKLHHTLKSLATSLQQLGIETSKL